MKTKKKTGINKRTESKENKKMHQCLFCSYSSNCTSNLNKHVNNKHTKNIYYNCKQCDKKYTDRSGLANHVKAKHLKLKPYNCTMCDYKCANKAMLNLHINSIHTKDNLFSCDYCSLVTTRKSSLKSHIVNMHSVDESKVIKYSCDHCSYTSKLKACLLRHLNLHFRWKTYDCSICERKFYDRGTLNGHVMNIHAPDTKKYSCDLCDYKALQPRQLREHTNVVHTQALIYHCDVPGCDAKYISKKSWYYHKSSQHNDNPIVYTCLHCNYKAKAKSVLKRHIINRHLKTRK